LQSIKKALKQYKFEQPPQLPLFIFDDIHDFVNKKEGVPKLDPNADALVSWALEMVNQQLMTFVMLTSEEQVIAPLKKGSFFASDEILIDYQFIPLVSGFSSRLDVEHIPFVDNSKLKEILCKNWKISHDLADRVVGLIGGNMGDLEAISLVLPENCGNSNITHLIEGIFH
jgi:hypothetical protein